MGSRVCAQCGHAASESARFCEQCGSALTPDGAPLRAPDPLAAKILSQRAGIEDGLLEAALAGLPGAGMSVIATSAAHDASALAAPPGSRVERFVPHEPILGRASCVVCHGGMGITQKALAAGLPVVIVPFGRDQLETARRVEVAEAGVRLPPKKLSGERLAAAVTEAIKRRAGAERVRAAYEAAGGPGAAADEIEQLAA